MKNDDKKFLSVQELLHLQSDKHDKKDQIMPDVDTSKFVLKQTVQRTARNFIPTAKISDEERRQFNQNTTPNRDARLAEQARRAIEVVEMHAKEEAAEQATAAVQDPMKTDEEINKLAKEIKSGNLEFGFGALIGGAENLKDTI